VTPTVTAEGTGTPTGTAVGLADLRQPDDPGASDWLNQYRASAFEWLDLHGFPTAKNEDWKYFRLGAILATPFSPGRSGRHPDLSSAIIDDLLPDLGGPKLVFVNGHLRPELSSIPGPETGVELASLASILAAHPSSPPPLFTTPGTDHLDGFAALNAGLAQDGACLLISADAVVAQPIQLVYCTAGASDPVWSTTRSMVLAGANSRATLVETHVGIDDGGVCGTNAVTRIQLEPGAQLDHCMIQNAPLTAMHFGVLDVTQATGSRFSTWAFSLGAAMARHEARLRLEGEGSDAMLAGLYLSAGQQYIAPNCTSRQVYNGVLDGRGHGVFNGRIVVQPTANGTDATQSNKNLVLSDQAEIDTRPRLEILTDDVACSHGATVGQLDDDAIYYLRSRGISEPAARAMLTAAFATEIVQRIEVDPLRDWVLRLVSQRLDAAELPEPGIGSPMDRSQTDRSGR
jgi:Fe-S cluster assembly protein SufD